jgi:hypothetical protein
MRRCRVPRKRLCDLSGDPVGRRVGSDGDMDQLSPLVAENKRAEQQFKAGGRNDKKSIEAIPSAWFRRNVFHDCEGRRRPRTMYLATVDCATSIPSFRSSP